MSKFRNKRGKETPKVSTASLPDIVFMLLFFFMVVTVIREKEILVDVSLPDASEVTKLVNRQKTEHIYIGQPIAGEENAAAVIQINDRFYSVDKIQYLLSNPAKEKHTVALQVDKDVTMGIVSDVKLEIRKANRLKLHYMAYKDLE